MTSTEKSPVEWLPSDTPLESCGILWTCNQSAVCIILMCLWSTYELQRTTYELSWIISHCQKLIWVHYGFTMVHCFRWKQPEHSKCQRNTPGMRSTSPNSVKAWLLAPKKSGLSLVLCDRLNSSRKSRSRKLHQLFEWSRHVLNSPKRCLDEMRCFERSKGLYEILRMSFLTSLVILVESPFCDNLLKELGIRNTRLSRFPKSCHPFVAVTMEEVF